MKYFLSLLMLVMAMSLTAQNSHQSMTETCDQEGYSLKMKVSKNKADQLQRTYNALTGQPADRKISGVATHEGPSGTMIELNTRKNSLLISYTGTDEEALKVAKALGASARKSFGTPPLPPPPPPPPGINK